MTLAVDKETLASRINEKKKKKKEEEEEKITPIDAEHHNYNFTIRKFISTA